MAQDQFFLTKAQPAAVRSPSETGPLLSNRVRCPREAAVAHTQLGVKSSRAEADELSGEIGRRRATVVLLYRMPHPRNASSKRMGGGLRLVRRVAEGDSPNR